MFHTVILRIIPRLLRCDPKNKSKNEHSEKMGMNVCCSYAITSAADKTVIKYMSFVCAGQMRCDFITEVSHDKNYAGHRSANTNAKPVLYEAFFNQQLCAFGADYSETGDEFLIDRVVSALVHDNTFFRCLSNSVHLKIFKLIKF